MRNGGDGSAYIHKEKEGNQLNDKKAGKKDAMTDPDNSLP